MVRLKNRYLLVNILYPELDNKPAGQVPDVVVFNQPTTSSLTASTLLKGLRAEVSNSFGDYGSGAVAERLVVKYLSTATSTFIIRVSRDHYRVAWAALSLMNRVPVRDGRKCVFRVVRVSGTIRKAQEELVRRAREMMLKAQREVGEHGDATLDGMFGKGEDKESSTKDVQMADRSDTEEEEDFSDGDD